MRLFQCILAVERGLENVEWTTRTPKNLLRKYFTICHGQQTFSIFNFCLHTHTHTIMRCFSWKSPLMYIYEEYFLKEVERTRPCDLSDKQNSDSHRHLHCADISDFN